jgi:hypothetical protein
MSIRKIIAIVFLSAFVLVLPITFVATNLNVRIANPDSVTDLFMNSILDDDKL